MCTGIVSWHLGLVSRNQEKISIHLQGPHGVNLGQPGAETSRVAPSTGSSPSSVEPRRSEKKRSTKDTGGHGTVGEGVFGPVLESEHGEWTRTRHGPVSPGEKSSKTRWKNRMDQDGCIYANLTFGRKEFHGDHHGWHHHLGGLRISWASQGSRGHGIHSEGPRAPLALLQAMPSHANAHTQSTPWDCYRTADPLTQLIHRHMWQAHGAFGTSYMSDGFTFTALFGRGSLLVVGG